MYLVQRYLVVPISILMMMLPHSSMCTGFVYVPCRQDGHGRRGQTTASVRRRYPLNSEFLLHHNELMYLRQTSRMWGEWREQSHPQKSKQQLILPIFPLRKRVKLPTQTLQLTLWEERYKALSRNVLQQSTDPKLFGALYCSHKTQIVTEGINPITPLVEVGDVGVVCCVLNSQVFVDGEEVDRDLLNEGKVQKIRINGLGVGRFRVEEILSTGFGVNHRKGDDLMDNDNELLPFIMVRGRRIDDEEVFEVEQDCDMDSIMELQQRVLRSQKLMNKAVTFAQLTTNDYAWSFDVGGDEEQKRQLISFAMASNFEANTSSSEMLRLLQCTSTSERLAYIEEKLLPKSNGILSMLASVIKQGRR